MKRFKTVDAYIESEETWQAELNRLREILTSTELEETVKWGGPCYTYNGKNVVGMAAFKSYVGLWFYQGAQLGDPQGVLINAQDGKTKALRQWRFESSKEIKVRAIKAYVKEAIAIVEEGKEIKPERGKPVDVPAELQTTFSKNKKLATAFSKLTPGKQREYAGYVAEAKRAETKQKRIEKISPMILEGKGLNDKYR